MKKTLYVAAAMASALSLSTPATAGFFDFTLTPYVGASGGQSTTDSCVKPQNTGSGTCDDKDTAWKIYGGMEMNEYISMEVGYVDLGTINYSAPAGSRKTTGAIIQVVGTYALNPSFTLMARGGMNILNTEVNGALAATSVNNSGNTDVVWSAGLGAQYNFNKTVGLRMEWERYFEAGDPTDTGEADIDLVSAGVVFKF